MIGSQLWPFIVDSKIMEQLNQKEFEKAQKTYADFAYCTKGGKTVV